MREVEAVSNVGHCRDCNATIVWSTTVKGSRISLNPIPIRVAMVIQREEGAPVDLKEAYVPHVVTCAKKRASERTRA